MGCSGYAAVKESLPRRVALHRIGARDREVAIEVIEEHCSRLGREMGAGAHQRRSKSTMMMMSKMSTSAPPPMYMRTSLSSHALLRGPFELPPRSGDPN